MPEKILRREKKLTEISSQKSRLVMSLEDLRDLDNDLVEKWGVDFLGKDQNFDDLIGNNVDPDNYASFKKIMEEAEAVIRKGAKDTITVEDELYTIMAKPPFLGPVTSKRRATIIDSISLAAGLIRELKISGPVLDVGTHVGIIPHALANRLPNEFVGIDPCAAAIETGRKLSTDLKNLRLDVDRVPSNSDSVFEMIIAVGSMAQTLSNVAMFLKNLSTRLEDGGVAMIVSTYWTDVKIEVLRRQLHKVKLGFGLADVVGGFERSPPEYGATGTLVFVKGGSSKVPRRLRNAMESNWESFSEYSNTSTTSQREMTQAFHRAKARGWSAN